MQNGFVERLNRTYREDVLDAYLFNNLKQVRAISEEWVVDYNTYHPHQSLQGYSPIGYRQAVESGKLRPAQALQVFATCNSGSSNNSSDLKN